MNYRKTSGLEISDPVTEISYSCESPKNLSLFYGEDLEDDTRGKLNLLRSRANESLFLIKQMYQKRYKQILRSHSKFISTCSFFHHDESISFSAGVNEKRKQDLIVYFDETTKLKVKETEAKLASVWRPRINELLLILREKQEMCYDKGEDYESDCLENRKKILVEFRQKHEEDLEKMYFRDFEIKKLQVHERRRDQFNELMSQIQDSNRYRFHSLKLEFKSQYISELESKLLESTSYNIKMQESKIRSQAEFEVHATIQSLKSDLDLALKSKFHEIDSEEKPITLSCYTSEFSNWLEELNSEPNFINKQEQIIQLKRSFNSKIKQDLIEKIASETLLKRSLIYEDLNSSFASTFQAFQAKLNEESKKKTQEIEEKFQSNFFSSINQNVEKALRPIEIKIKMNHHKRLDLLKETMKQDMEKRFQVQYRNFKRTVELEKISLGQYKANCNVMNTTLNNELKSQIGFKTKEKSLLAKKSSSLGLIRMDKSLVSDSMPMRLDELKANEEDLAAKDEKRERKNGNQRKSYDGKRDDMAASQTCRENQSILSSYLSKSLSTVKPNLRPQSYDQEIVKIINKPLPPPSVFSGINSSSGKQSSNLVTTESIARNFKMITPSATADLLNSLISSSNEKSSSHSRCQSASQTKTHKKYENLLSKHHGYICPRNK